MASIRRKLTQANYNAIRDHLFDRIHKTGEQVKNDFPNILRTAIKNEAWKHFSDAEGKPFKNLAEWLLSAYPNGTGMGHGKHAISYDEALKLTEAVSDVHGALEHDSPSKRIRDKIAKSAPPRRYKPSLYAQRRARGPGGLPTVFVRRNQEHIRRRERSGRRQGEATSKSCASESGISKYDDSGAKAVLNVDE